MNAGAVLLLAIAVAIAAGDWVAVHLGKRPLEYVCKPLTMVALIGVASALDVDGGDEAVLTWVIIALALSLVGDVFLMLPERGDGPSRTFVAGLSAFLLGHVAYVVAFWLDDVAVARLAAGAVVVAVAVTTIGRRIVRAVRASAEAELAGPVLAYLSVISLMVVSAVGTGEPLAIAGAGFFYCSDALIAWNRFVHKQSHGRLAVIVTYHLAQILLVTSLAT